MDRVLLIQNQFGEFLSECTITDGGVPQLVWNLEDGLSWEEDMGAILFLMAEGINAMQGKPRFCKVIQADINPNN